MGFIRQKFSDSDKRDLKSSYSFHGGWKALGLVTILCVFGPFIFPLIPPKYGHNVGATGDNYTMINFLWLPTLLLIVFLFIAIRLLLDFMIGYKIIGDFQVTKVLTIGPAKILILDRWRLFILKKSEAYFEKVQVDCKVQITRTGTHRLMDYYVYDKNASA
jgi:hypothetical protein